MTTLETIERLDNIIAKLDESDGMFVYGMLNKIEALQREVAKLKNEQSLASWNNDSSNHVTGWN